MIRWSPISIEFCEGESAGGRVLRDEAAYLIRAAMVPLLNRHFSWGVVRLPLEPYLQLISEASDVQSI